MYCAIYFYLSALLWVQRTLLLKTLNNSGCCGSPNKGELEIEAYGQPQVVQKCFPQIFSYVLMLLSLFSS